MQMSVLGVPAWSLPLEAGRDGLPLPPLHLEPEAGSSTHGKGREPPTVPPCTSWGLHPPLGLAARRLEGQRGLGWREQEGQAAHRGQVSGFQNPRKRVRAQEKRF